MKKIIVALLCLGLGACLPRYTDSYRVKDYTQVPMIEMPVNRVDMTSDVAGLSALPHVENIMPTTPEKALKSWALIRLRPTYQTDMKAKFVIKEASVVRSESPQPRLFTYDNYTYRLAYKVALEIYDGKTLVREVETEGFVEDSLPQRASQRDRDVMFMDMLSKMEDTLDGKFVEEIKQKLVDL